MTAPAMHNQPRLARLLLPTGIALLVAGGAVGGLLDPWWVGAVVAGLGVTDLLLSFALLRMAGGSR